MVKFWLALSMQDEKVFRGLCFQIIKEYGFINVNFSLVMFFWWKLRGKKHILLVQNELLDFFEG